VTLIAVVRYNADGTLDSSFSTDGMVTSAPYGIANGVAIDSSGNIVVAGTTTVNSGTVGNSDFIVSRFTSTGAHDNTFGSGGTVITDFKSPTFDPTASQTDDANAIAIQADGKIVVAGRAENTVYAYDLAVARYTATGSLDGSFGTGGKVTATMQTYSNNVAYGVAVQSDGSIVAGGQGKYYEFAVMKFSSSGVRTAYASTQVGTGNNYVRAMTLQADGKIVLLGFLSGDNFALVRFNADCTLDNSFGSGGKVQTDLGTGARPYALAVQADGKIVAAGTSANDFAVARYIP
jgi:uncharacterized delta-60 repeat protein